MDKDNLKSQHQLAAINANKDISFVFNNDELLMRIYKRSERISKAFFLLTSEAKETDVIAQSIKRSCLELIVKSKAILAGNNSVDHIGAVKDIISELMSLISMSDIAISTSLISPQHQSIIKSQIEILISDLILSYKRNSEENKMPLSLFDISDFDVSDKTTDRDSFKTHININTSNVLKDQSVKSLKKLPIVSGNKNDRQESILNAIRSKGELSIKDLVGVIKGCSEKTIQRELISLVQDGTLLKTGERRWSRYSLK